MKGEYKMGKWSLKKDEKEYLLSEESAQDLVHEVISFYKIDIDGFSSKNIQDSLAQSFVIMQDAYRRGLLENEKTEDGGLTVVQHLEKNGPKGDGHPIKYRE
jgi:hypothetical protein